MTGLRLFYFAMLFFPVVLQAQTPEWSQGPATTLPPPVRQPSSWRMGLLGSTDVASFLGGGVTLQNPSFSVSVQSGTIPSQYQEIMADYYAESSGESANRQLALDSMQSNDVQRVDFTYKFQGASGWFMGLSMARISSRGRTGLNSALAAVTKEDLSLLMDTLEFMGLDLKVDIKTEKIAAELYGGYNWFLNENAYIGLAVGASKFVNVDLQVSAGLGALEETPPIKQIIDGLEKDFQNSIANDSFAPMMSLTIGFLF